MRVERIEDALVLRLGTGEWYNQRAWDMFEDAGFPTPGWYLEFDEAIRAHEAAPPVVVIDATEIIWVTVQDYGYFAELSERLNRSGINLKVVANPNSVRAHAIIRNYLTAPFEMTCTIEEALGRERGPSQSG